MSIDFDFPAGDAQNMAPGDLVDLYVLDCSGLSWGTVSDVYRFTPAPYGSEPVRFDSKEYAPIEVSASGFDVSGQGTLPRPKIAISNLALALSGLVIAHKDLLGAKVTRIRTFSKYLDQGSEPSPTIMFPPDEFFVEQKTRHDNEVIEWTLNCVMDKEGKKLPAWQMLRDVCLHRYRRWDSSLNDFDYNNATCDYSDETKVPKAIAGATKANPCVITTAANHGYLNGSTVTIDNTINGMTELRNTTWAIHRLSANTFSLDGCNSTGYGAYTSGGNAIKEIFFTRLGYVTDAANDVCGKKLSDCRKRYCGATPLPFRGFPSMAKTRV